MVKEELEPGCPPTFSNTLTIPPFYLYNSLLSTKLLKWKLVYMILLLRTWFCIKLKWIQTFNSIHLIVSQAWKASFCEQKLLFCMKQSIWTKPSRFSSQGWDSKIKTGIHTQGTIPGSKVNCQMNSCHVNFQGSPSRTGCTVMQHLSNIKKVNAAEMFIIINLKLEFDHEYEFDSLTVAWKKGYRLF